MTDAADGQFAQRLTITRTDGDAKLVPTFDSVNCAPLVTVGRPYNLAVSYKSNASTFITLYRQDTTTGAWSYWTQSPAFPAAAYTRAAWTTPAVPAGTRAVSFGLEPAATNVERCPNSLTVEHTDRGRYLSPMGAGPTIVVKRRKDLTFFSAWLLIRSTP